FRTPLADLVVERTSSEEGSPVRAGGLLSGSQGVAAPQVTSEPAEGEVSPPGRGRCPGAEGGRTSQPRTGWPRTQAGLGLSSPRAPTAWAAER
ncbi:unnamed protein product, partial [Gulo gulo]